MKLLLAHENPDLDALGALALVRRLHPDGRIALAGALDGSARAAYTLYRDALRLETWAEVEPELPEEGPSGLVVVDTHDSERLGPPGQFADRTLEVWDHHPEGDLSGRAGVIAPMGSCVTLLARRLHDLGIQPTELEATLALAGLMDDTRNLSTDLTQLPDFEAAAWLAAAGADLSRARELREEPLSPEGRALLARALERGRVVPVGGRPVLAYSETLPEYVAAAGVAEAALELASAEAVVLALGLERREVSDVVVRVRGNAYDGGAAAADLGGGGHPGAASVRLEAQPEAALERFLGRLAAHATPARTVAEAMTRQVRTLEAGEEVGEAVARLARFGHSGAPVVDGEGALVGVVTRRDLERAVRHNLASAPVRSVMARDVVTAAPDEPLEAVEARMRARSVGRVPVLEGGRLVGILSRSDLLAPPAPAPVRSVAERALAAVPETERALLGRVVREHLPPGAGLYLVGGAVRDALLGRPALDLDLVVEGESAADLARRVGSALGLAPAVHQGYGNATVALPGGGSLDFIAARDEFYAHPGAAPTVAPGSLAQDLARRDFTVNAMALRLTAPGGTLGGELIDPHGGLADLEAGLLRTLHPLSFLEDPTRIVRGARLAVRLGLALHPEAEASIAPALEGARPYLDGSRRLADELRLVLAEGRPGAVAGRLASFGALEDLYGPLTTLPALERLDGRRERGEEVTEEVYALAWLAGTENPEHFAERWGWPRRLVAGLGRLRGASDDLARAALGEAEAEALVALEPDLEPEVREARARPPRVLRGADVLALGVSPGPGVGALLAEVAAARERGEVQGFEAELEYARRRLADDPARKATP